MGKLHELLAVDTDREKIFKKVTQEGADTFRKKADHFLAHHKTLRMKDDERKMEEEAAEDHKEMVTTVPQKLEYVAGPTITYLDTMLQKEKTNQQATADLVLPDGSMIGSGLPATFLLGLENRLKFIRGLYEAIPTLSPGTKWEVDTVMGDGVFRSVHPEVSQKTEKHRKYETIAEATENHPAQVAAVDDNVTVGVFTTQRWSGMVSPARKSELLARVDSLIEAAKQARQRANTQETVNDTIGKNIIDYING